MAIGNSQSPEVSYKILCVEAFVSAGSTMTCIPCLKSAGTQTGSEPIPIPSYRESGAQAQRANVIYFIALGRHLSNCSLVQGFECSKPKMKQNRQAMEPSGNQEKHLSQHHYVSAQHKSFVLINKSEQTLKQSKQLTQHLGDWFSGGSMNVHSHFVCLKGLIFLQLKEKWRSG